MPPMSYPFPGTYLIILFRWGVSFNTIPSIGLSSGFRTRTTRRLLAPGLMASVASKTNGVSLPSWPPKWRPFTHTSAR